MPHEAPATPATPGDAADAEEAAAIEVAAATAAASTSSALNVAHVPLDEMTDADVEDAVARVAKVLRSGWRGTDEQLRTLASLRVKTAQRHLVEARAARSRADRRHFVQPLRVEFAGLRQFWVLKALTLEVRAAVNLGLISRMERDAALRLVPTWSGADVDELLAAARALLT